MYDVQVSDALRSLAVGERWDYCGRRLRLHSPCTERMTERSAVTPIASVPHTKKTSAPCLAAAKPRPFPLIWNQGTSNPSSDPRSMMMYPDRRPVSISVPYNQETRMGNRTRFESPPFS